MTGSPTCDRVGIDSRAAQCRWAGLRRMRWEAAVYKMASCATSGFRQGLRVLNGSTITTEQIYPTGRQAPVRPGAFVDREDARRDVLTVRLLGVEGGYADRERHRLA